MPDRHAVYATVRVATQSTHKGRPVTIEDPVTFRIGQPVGWGTAQDRYERLRDRAIRRGVRVRHNRRWYRVDPILLEVRGVDRHGRGLGSERHGRAIPVPYRLARLIGGAR